LSEQNRFGVRWHCPAAMCWHDIDASAEEAWT
jgi:hypothetical protein